MTQFDEFLQRTAIECASPCASKKKALETLSALLARHAAADEARIFDSLLARERLGTTGLGFGVAIPHGRLDNLEHSVGALLVLSQGIDFDAPDGEPVDLLFGLLVPQACNDEHLQLLARLAQMFNDEAVRGRLREQPDPQALRKVLEASLSNPAEPA